MRKKCTKFRKCKNFGKILLRFWKYFAKSYHFYTGLGLLNILLGMYHKKLSTGGQSSKGRDGWGGQPRLCKKPKFVAIFLKAFPVKIVAIFAFHLYMKWLWYKFIFSWKIMLSVHIFMKNYAKLWFIFPWTPSYFYELLNFISFFHEFVHVL